MKKILLFLLCALLLLAMSACSQEAAAPKDCNTVSQAILASQTFAESMTEQTSKRMLRALGLEEEMISQGVMTLDASRATAECVIVLTAASKDALPQVQALLKEYLDALLIQYRDYRPDEVPKLEAASVKTNGLQCALIIAPDQQKAVEALNEAWK